MKPLLHDDFLLTTDTARQLYHNYAAKLPIIDYHSHLDAGALAADRRFGNITEVWIEPDQYKHRAMRGLGVAERLITGDASPREKFDQWAAALPQTLGHPLFHWSAMELQQYCGVTEPLHPGSASRIWEQANEALAGPSLSSRQMLCRANVECVCTSDRWLDDLSAHAALARSDYPVLVLPSLRADDAVAVEGPQFRDWVGRLGAATHVTIKDLDGYLQALGARLDVFAAHGCTVADHGIDAFCYQPSDKSAAAAGFLQAITTGDLAAPAAADLRNFLLSYLSGEYARRGWVLQLHLGAHRYTSSRLRRLVGPAGGFATIGGCVDVSSLCTLLDELESREALPKTILYPLNPSDYAALATLTGSFVEEGTAGKVQLGPAWWFNDHALGIRQHLDAVSHYGSLATFIGMTTDSRSLLSMVRHEYFRRVLCDWFGAQVKSGSFPQDLEFLGTYVRRIAYDNIRGWLPSPNAVRK